MELIAACVWKTNKMEPDVEARFIIQPFLLMHFSSFGLRKKCIAIRFVIFNLIALFLDRLLGDIPLCLNREILQGLDCMD